VLLTSYIHLTSKSILPSTNREKNTQNFGNVAEDYQVICELGRGSFGQVYKVHVKKKVTIIYYK
jgi:serine/threonine protein kinase